MPGDQIAKTLKEILANKDMIQRVRDLNLDKKSASKKRDI